MKRGVLTMAVVVASSFVACDKGKSDSTKEKGKTGSSSEGPTDLQPPGTKGTGDKTGQESVAIERRLYSDEVEASSFLWVNYNRFQENYHPNYIMDGDPVTTWIEGAEGEGHGEWVRIHTSKVEKASNLRLRLRNGYHKTPELFKKNARVKELTLRILPEGTTQLVLLPDDMEWFEVEVPMPKADFEGVELRVDSTYAGTKYRDTCISDVEIFVTGQTPDNPAFEAKKLAKINSWKAERREAATIFASTAASELPIRAGYRVTRGPTFELKKIPGKNAVAKAALNEIKPHTEGADKYIALALQALDTDFDSWKPYRIVVRNPIALPAVDGLISSEVANDSVPTSAFVIPRYKRKSLVHAKSLALFEGKAEDLVQDEEECEPNTIWAMRPKESGPSPRQLLVWNCLEYEERDGMHTELAWQLLEYDEAGWLQLIVGPQYAQSFHWEESDSGPMLSGGVRLRSWDKKIQFLKSREVLSAKSE